MMLHNELITTAEALDPRLLPMISWCAQTARKVRAIIVFLLAFLFACYPHFCLLMLACGLDSGLAMISHRFASPRSCQCRTCR